MSDTFWQRGYYLAHQLVRPDQLTMLAKAMDLTQQDGRMIDQSYTHATDALGAYNPSLGGLLLRHCKALIEEIIDRDLLENYAYWRLYREGSALLPHTDRPGCEITATITIETAPGGEDWPIMVQDLEGDTRAIAIPPGAGLLFRGDVLQHWRDPLAGAWQKQLFLHYVLKDGEFAEFANDGRRGDHVSRRLPL